ncbi:MAG: discoidin domain-containing protein [Fibrobacterales bacterium]
MKITSKILTAAALLLSTTVSAQHYELVSQNKTAYASSEESNQLSAANAFDGNGTSRWGSSFSDNEWIAVDLGESVAVSRIILNWENAYATKYSLSFSEDGQTWKGPYTWSTTGQGGIETIDYNFGTAQHVKLHCDERVTQYGCSLYEIEIYQRTLETANKSTMVDFRDGQKYETTTIGNQEWLAENLNYESQEGSVCYNNSEKFCETFGRLYTWDAAMAGSESSAANPSNVQGICPEDWHLPSAAEWDELIAYVDVINGSDEAGYSLKAQYSWQDNNDHDLGNGNDEFGFGAVAGGDQTSRSSRIALYGQYLTSEEVDAQYAKLYAMMAYNDLIQGTIGKKTVKFSIRCVKN